ncbi:basic leucine zipper 23-like isoform X1 [Iris pallida]|uniref:Basic leucine zipper 23-like isoform X1 n=1 Tax=Iris pallida TaxID=29817 RepID=A0AAX6I6R8_IRIPA|nr:basic leucine zipper 23-like isoform X1 [Iris pallida]
MEEGGGGGDLDFSSLPNSCSMDSFFDEILKADTHACTHTHTCNAPSGPDPSHHTHTCFHVHTKILSSSPGAAAADDAADSSADTAANPKSKKQQQRPFGNREAVRKYREKKKARAASLEDEVVQLRALNKQLMKRLQSQAALEAEVARLRCLLVDVRGRIEGEIGSFPYQKPQPTTMMPASAAAAAGNPMLGACEDLRCGDDRVYCVGEAGAAGIGQGCGSAGCDIGDVRCMGSSSSGSMDFFACGVGNGNGAMAGGYSADLDKIRVGVHAVTES